VKPKADYQPATLGALSRPPGWFWAYCAGRGKGQWTNKNEPNPGGRAHRADVSSWADGW
jgi:hypothetical protein